MSRPRRLHVRGGIYHVILRGNHRQPIFFGDADMLRLEALVADAVDLCGIRVHAYCWMPNHLHVAIQVADAPLGVAMMRIASRYARYVQRRVPTTGHLFERRYRAILVHDLGYLLELVRYIHLNPVRAGLVGDPAEFPWSGHRAYLGSDSRPWLTIAHVLRLFASEIDAARQAYLRHVLAGIGVEPPAELRGGGTGGRRRVGVEQRPVVAVLPRRDPPVTLDTLIEHVCAAYGLRPEDLAATGRSRSAARARTLVAHHAIRLNLGTLTDLARRFGRATSTLSESLDVARRRAPGWLATASVAAVESERRGGRTE